MNLKQWHRSQLAANTEPKPDLRKMLPHLAVSCHSRIPACKKLPRGWTRLEVPYIAAASCIELQTKPKGPIEVMCALRLIGPTGNQELGFFHWWLQQEGGGVMQRAVHRSCRVHVASHCQQFSNCFHVRKSRGNWKWSDSQRTLQRIYENRHWQLQEFWPVLET